MTRLWAQAKPTHKQRTQMLKRCGRKCFLGPNKSYPICSKHTCKINRKGVHAAYVRSRAQHATRIASKAKKILNKTRKKH